MFRLSSQAIDNGYRLEAFDSVGSTNALVMDRARAGDPGRLWIASTRQETGRGRRGRHWHTPEGNLAASLLLKVRADPAIAATLGFVAGLSLVEALSHFMPGEAIGIGLDGAEDAHRAGHDGKPLRMELKWPNDAIVEGAKLGGILLESMLCDDGQLMVATGIGVNVVAHPEALDYPAISLAALGIEATAGDVFTALSQAWCDHEALWDDGRGIAAIRDLWLKCAAGLGSPVAVRVDGTVIRGQFETIDEFGRFVIRDEVGALTRISAGDVHFGAVASVRSAIDDMKAS